MFQHGDMLMLTFCFSKIKVNFFTQKLKPVMLTFPKNIH